jgi:hypothetical protein
VANTGAAFHIDGQALNYICDPGYAAGIERTDQYDTTVAYAASEASGLSTVHVTTAWTG